MRATLFVTLGLFCNTARPSMISEGSHSQNGETESSQQVTYRTCSNSEQVDIWQQRVGCQPRPTVVDISPLLSDLEGLVSMTPRNVIVQRCVGACDDDGFWSSKSCLSTQTVNKTVKVMAFQANYGPGHLRDICTSVQVEEHASCTCGCRESASDCDPNVHYRHDPLTCRCQCANEQERYICGEEGKEWDERTCTCSCPHQSWQQVCSSGHAFDYAQSCGCVPVTLMATFGGSRFTVLAVVSVVALFSLCAFVLHAKRTRKSQDSLQHRRATIQISLMEAINQGGSQDSLETRRRDAIHKSLMEAFRDDPVMVDDGPIEFGETFNTGRRKGQNADQETGNLWE